MDAREVSFLGILLGAVVFALRFDLVTAPTFAPGDTFLRGMFAAMVLCACYVLDAEPSKKAVVPLADPAE